MKKKKFNINNIPAVIWGEDSERVIIAVHGNMSDKEDISIELFAGHAIDKGFQVLSFDLPKHGDRKADNTPCKVQFCVGDLNSVMKYAQLKWKHINLFANSMGAYFSLLAYKNEFLEKAWFLSPLVDMRRMIENMMKWFDISKEQLEKEQTVKTPIGQIMYWDDYSYVKEHPINAWNVKTNILYGSKDDVCEPDTITKFVEKFHCKLKVIQEAEHYFNTEEQLQEFNRWILETM